MDERLMRQSYWLSRLCLLRWLCGLRWLHVLVVKVVKVVVWVEG